MKQKPGPTIFLKSVVREPQTRRSASSNEMLRFSPLREVEFVEAMSDHTGSEIPVKVWLASYLEGRGLGAGSQALLEQPGPPSICLILWLFLAALKHLGQDSAFVFLRHSGHSSSVQKQGWFVRLMMTPGFKSG
jgi:hypothetical protein